MRRENARRSELNRGDTSSGLGSVFTLRNGEGVSEGEKDKKLTDRRERG